MALLFVENLETAVEKKNGVQKPEKHNQIERKGIESNLKGFFIQLVKTLTCFI